MAVVSFRKAQFVKQLAEKLEEEFIDFNYPIVIVGYSDRYEGRRAVITSTDFERTLDLLDGAIKQIEESAYP